MKSTNRMNTYTKSVVAVLLLSLAAACTDTDAPGIGSGNETEYADEWYPGGANGTAFDVTSRAFKQAMPAISEDAELNRAFMRGEVLFEKEFVSSTGQGYAGLGPTYIRRSCMACHPGYGGRSKRVDQYDTTEPGNGYLLMIYDPHAPGLPLATNFFTGMTQTRAVAPFKAPINEAGIRITWNKHVDEHGNKYEDGTPYSQGKPYEGTLIYPTVDIAQDAILFKDFDMSKHKACLEATIGIYGTGLLDAISDEDLRAQYAEEQSRGYCPGIIGADIDETGLNPYYPGKHPGRFTYLCTRATLDNGPGSNALWNITNVTRPDRKYNYMTAKYAQTMSQDTDVQKVLKQDETAIYNELMSQTLKAEMTQNDYDDFMVWHRGLAVPAARNLDNKEVQRGRTLFKEAGCVACHRPSWTTRDNYKPLPAISKQKIYPYTDLLRHDLDMVEPGRAKVCRTTPLWGRGLMEVCAGHTDMLHDLRARNYEEAILWHGGEAKQAKEKFRKMSKEDRTALVKFLQSI